MNTKLVILLALICAALMAIVLPLLMRVATHVELIDNPCDRKRHAQPTPVVGGVALLVSLLPLLFLTEWYATEIGPWLIGVLGLGVIGAVDDRVGLEAKRRLAAHLLMGLCLLPAGIVLTHLGNLVGLGQLSLGWVGLPLTLFAVASAINAMNMVDGVDGLLGLQALVPLLIIALFAGSAGLHMELAMALCLAAIILVFLLFNFRFPWRERAAVFMGDAGSTVIGFTLAWLVMALAMKHVLPPVLSLFLLAVPMLDLAGVISRRYFRGRSAAEPGRDHLHHILLDAGFSVRVTVLVMTGLSLLISGVAILFWEIGVPEWVLFLVFLAMLTSYVRGSRDVEAARISMSRYLALLSR